MDVVKIKLKNIFLDPNNYRLRSNPSWLKVDNKSILKPAIQKRTMNFICGESNVKISDLLESIKANGFLKVDSILVRKYDQDNYYVIEGNRRIAALKVLNEQFEKGYDIGKVHSDIFNEGIEVVLYDYSNEKDYLILMGLKHISGNKKWDFYNQARLLNELRDQGENEKEIAKKIGISRSAVEQQIKGYLAMKDFLDELDSEKQISEFDPYQKLQMFIEITSKPNIKRWIGWDDENCTFTNSVNKKRFFSWLIPKIGFNDDTGEEITYDHPIIVNHKQIRELDNFIEDENALKEMEDTRDFQITLNQSTSYSKHQFTTKIKQIEKILSTIQIGNILDLSSEEKKSISNIKVLLNKILSEKDNK